MILRPALALLCLATPAMADSYIMGAGRWPCSQVIEVVESGSPAEKAQLVGWIMGYWSFATGVREDAFVDKVQQAGAVQIADLTVAQCRKAPPETMLFRISGSIVVNTR